MQTPQHANGRSIDRVRRLNQLNRNSFCSEAKLVRTWNDLYKLVFDSEARYRAAIQNADRRFIVLCEREQVNKSEICVHSRTQTHSARERKHQMWMGAARNRYTRNQQNVPASSTVCPHRLYARTERERPNDEREPFCGMVGQSTATATYTHTHVLTSNTFCSNLCNDSQFSWALTTKPSTHTHDNFSVFFRFFL